MSIIVNIKERADKGFKKYVEANPFWQAIYYCFLKFAADETPIFHGGRMLELIAFDTPITDHFRPVIL